MDPEITVHPYGNGMQRRSTNGRQIYKQFSLVLIVRLEVYKPWKEVGGCIKTAGAINLLGFGQSSAEDSPPKCGAGEVEGEGGASVASSIQWRKMRRKKRSRMMGTKNTDHITFSCHIK